MAEITPGLAASEDHTVADADTASALGSGDVAALGTPRLLAWAESATCAAIAPALTETETSVGTRMRVEHLRPSPVGQTVTLSATVAHVDGRRVRLQVSAEDADGALVGHGEITRVVVNRQRFLDRLS